MAQKNMKRSQWKETILRLSLIMPQLSVPSAERSYKSQHQTVSSNQVSKSFLLVLGRQDPTIKTITMYRYCIFVLGFG